MSSAVAAGYFHNRQAETGIKQGRQTPASHSVKTISDIEIRGEAARVTWVGGVNKHTRQALQGHLMFAHAMDGKILFWLKGKKTNYLLLDFNHQPVSNLLEATERARELITHGAATDLFKLSDSYLNTQAAASNRPTHYVADADRWLSLGAYGSVELGKARMDWYIRTRHTHYRVPDDIDTSDRVAIAQWVIQAIEHDGISSKALYPVILPNSSTSRNPHSNNNVGKEAVSNRKRIRQWRAGTVLDRVPPGGQPRPESINFRPLSSPECWLGTEHGQVILGTNTDFPGRFIVKTKEENYYWVPSDLSQSRDSIRAWVERAINNESITTTLYPNLIEPHHPEHLPKIGKDLRFLYTPVQQVVDEEYGHELTTPMRPVKKFADDFTLRVQPWRGDASFMKPLKPKEELLECKLISTLGRPGCDIKSKWIFPTEKFPILHTMLKRIHGKIEFESSGAVRYVGGQILGQGALAIKLNVSNPEPGSLIRLVVGLEFPQFSAPMMPMVQRVLPHLAQLYELLTSPRKNPAEFARRFDDLAAQILIPITMLGGQISLVYPSNNAIKKGLSMMSASAAGTGSEPLAAILKGAAMTLAGLEKATGFNIRIAYTHTLRDPQVELDSGNFVPGDRPNVILVAKNSNGRTVTAQRMEFARAWFGERFLDPALSEHAQALFERGFNAFQVATLIPLPEHKPKSDKLAHDPLKALLSPPAFIPQRLKYYPLMQLADQISLAVIDIRGRLPANALRTVPRIFNSYKDTAVAIQQILKIIRSYAFNNQPTSLEKHLIASLVNPYGVDWGTPQVRALNREKYGISAPGQKLTEQLQASEKTRYLVTGTPDDKPEIIMKRDSPEKQYVFSIWQDNFNGRSSQQKRHFGLVSPHSPIGLQKSLNQALL